jgi:hypothetical protein
MPFMATTPNPTTRDQVGAAVGAFVAILLAGALSGARDTIGATNTALVLAGVVVLAAITGPVAAIATALAAATAFNFFFTRPYGSLRIDDGHDIATVVLLVALGAIVATVGEWRRRASSTSSSRRIGEAALEGALELLARRAAVDEIAAYVCEQCTRELSLADCRYESRPTTDLPAVGRTGALPGTHHHLGAHGMELPAGGATIPVVADGRGFGQLVLVPAVGTSASRDQRRVAVALADALATAAARHAGARA